MKEVINMNNTNETETKENKNNLHVIKCEEKKTDFYQTGSKNNLDSLNMNELQMIQMSEGLKVKLASIIINIICIIFIIFELATLISDNKSYKKFKEYLISNPGTIIFRNYTEFWKDIRINEIAILISNLLLLILILLFLIFIVLKKENKIQVTIGSGIFYNTILIINFVLFALTLVFAFLYVYLIIYSFFVVFKTPYDFSVYEELFLELKNDWKKNRVISIVHSSILIPLFYLFCYFEYLLKNNLEMLLQMDFDEIHQNKNSRLCINDLYFNVKIKPKNLFLLQSKENKEDFYKIANANELFFFNSIAFKEIYINEFINEYIYIVLNYFSIDDQMSFANIGYKYLFNNFFMCFGILLFIIPSAKFHIINEEFYDLLILDLEKMKFGGITKIYGNFEKNVFYSSLIIFIIESLVFFILVVIRLIYGGFKNIIFIKSSIFFYILSAIIHSIFMVLYILIFLFSILILNSMPSGSLLDNLENTENTNYFYFSVIKIKLIFQIVLSAFKLMLFIANIKFLINNIRYQFDIIKSRKQMTDNIVKTDLEKEIVFEYIDLNNNKKTLTEFRMQGFPKYLFFKSEEANNVKLLTQNKEIGIVEICNTDGKKINI